MNTVKDKERTKCVTYARPMWYIAPVQNFNIWKRQEYKDRVWFQEDKVDNSQFLKRWLTAKTLEW